MNELSLTIFLSAAIGSSLPDLIRILRMAREEKLHQVKIIEVVASVLICGVLGVIAVLVTKPASYSQAILIGAAAPAVLTRLIAAAGDDSMRNIRKAELFLIDWWNK